MGLGAVGTDAVGESDVGVFRQVFVDGLPVVLVVADLVAVRADRQEAFEGDDLRDVLEDQQDEAVLLVKKGDAVTSIWRSRSASPSWILIRYLRRWTLPPSAAAATELRIAQSGQWAVAPQPSSSIACRQCMMSPQRRRRVTPDSMPKSVLAAAFMSKILNWPSTTNTAEGSASTTVRK